MSKIQEIFKNRYIFFQLNYLNIGVTIKKLPSIQKKGTFELEKKIFLLIWPWSFDTPMYHCTTNKITFICILDHNYCTKFGYSSHSEFCFFVDKSAQITNYRTMQRRFFLVCGFSGVLRLICLTRSKKIWNVNKNIR